MADNESDIPRDESEIHRLARIFKESTELLGMTCQEMLKMLEQAERDIGILNRRIEALETRIEDPQRQLKIPENS